MNSRTARRRPTRDRARSTGPRRWARAVGLLLTVLLLALLGWHLFPGGGADRVVDTKAGLDPKITPIRIDPGLEIVDNVSAGTGALADCNLVLVTLDTTRADRIGCYGNRQIETPTLDRLASEGVLFSAATAVAPTTLPSHASLLTGLYPAHHGVRTNGYFRLEAGHETLAERLRSEGFRTGAIVSSFVLDSQFGLSQGFDRYDDDLADADEAIDRHFRSRRADRTTDRAISWLRDAAQDRFFLWVHYFDPHHDYSPPSPFSERYADQPYDGEIAFVDSELKRLIDALGELGLSERCLVVVVGDHGEGLGEHHEYSHSFLTYESTLHVPLLMHCGTRLGGGVHCPRPVSQVDILPSVLDLLGLDPMPGDGLAVTTDLPADRPVFFESLAGSVEYDWEPLVGVVRGSHKYIHSSAPELYDLSGDPHELRNLLSVNASRATQLREQLPGLFGPDLNLATRVTPTVRPSSDDLERLQALGYLAGGGGDRAGSHSGGVPQQMIQLLNRVELARSAGLPLEQSVANLREVLSQRPDFYPAWKALGGVYLRGHDLEGAAEALSECVRLKPGLPQAVFGLAGVKVSQHLPEQALRLLEPLLREYPEYLRGRYLYGLILSSLGRWQESVDHFKTVFESDPDYEDCLTYMLTALGKAHDTRQLRDILGEYLEQHPGSTETRLALALQFSKRKQDQAARSLLQNGLKLYPGDIRIIHRLALLLISSADRSVRDEQAALALLQPFAEQGAEEPPLMYTLCAIQAGAGRMEEALSIGLRARELAVKNGNAKLVKALDRQLNEVVRPALGSSPRK